VASQPIPLLTPEQYLALERAAEFRIEYIDGRVVAMAGGSRNHGRISAAILSLLWSQLRNTDCEASNSDNRLSIPAWSVYTYPDLWVSCGKVQHTDEHQDTALNPCVAIEVLSPSTESYDRGQKFLYYRSIAALTDYLLFSQDRIAAVLHHRQADGSWTLRDYTSANDIIEIPSINCNLRLAEVYERVELPE
jgi:Uma2 family endonuclease